MASFVHQHHAFGHLGGNGVKFPLFVLKFPGAALKLYPLGIHPLQNGCQFLIGVAVGIVQIQLVQGPYHHPGQSPGQPQGQSQGHQDHQGHGPRQGENQIEYRLLAEGKAEHGTIGQPLGGVHRLFQQGVGKTGAFAVTGFQCLTDFLTLEVIFHWLGSHAAVE